MLPTTALLAAHVGGTIASWGERSMATNIEDLKILLVEDNLQARTMIRMVCKELGINEV